jgi:outer membrane lipoprotein-sorting protein
MQMKKFLFFTAICTLGFSAAATVTAQDLQSVLARMDAASAKFHTTSADVEFIGAQTYPIPDTTEDQRGTVYYKRDGATYQMGVHIDTDQGKPSPKVVVCCMANSIKLYDKLQDQVRTLGKLSQYEDWFMLGFGASGKELAAKWEIKYVGPETVDGIKTEKLELVPKDPKVLDKVHKVILWMDADRAVSVKQYFDQGEGYSRTCHYTNIKVNQALPKDAFTFATDNKTTYVNQ